MEILGVIPARGGSKGIPRKNIVQLAGRPLLAYTCDAALAGRRLGRVVLSTDDAEIAQIGQALGVGVPFLRPASLARDETLVLDVLTHLLDWLERQEGYAPDALALLQPTSPLRRAEHVDAAIDHFIAGGADTVVSVVTVPHNFSPTSVMRVSEDGSLVPFLDGELILRRQDKPRVYARSGPAVLVSRTATVRSGRLYGERVLPYEMSLEESIDIDTPTDLRVAEFWLRGT